MGAGQAGAVGGSKQFRRGGGGVEYSREQPNWKV